MSSDKDLIQELRTESIRHLTTAFAQVRCEALGALNTLPYEQLLGPGLERLCFELLLTNGFEPRFFGRSGQAQFEVDLIASKDGRTELYQCKNTQLHQKDISRILEAFETQWLGQQGLPQPARYVICSPSLLRDVMQDRHWLQAKQAIETRHPGLSVELWHRDMLDGWLKRLPDVVADLFSDRHAELFCGLDDWHPGLFTAVREDAPGDPRLDRFLEQHGKAGVYLHPPYQSALDEALAASPVVLVHGRQACGKTFAALTHASGGNARGWRSYFIDVGGDDFDRGALYDGVRRRSTRPSLFVLENAHAKPEEVALGLRKLRQHLSGGRVRVICLSRIDLSDDDLPTDAHAVFAELKETGATVAFANDEKVLLGLLRHLRPDLDGLSPARRQRLFALSGRDLLALSELLRGIADPAQIDTLSVTDLYDTLRRQYFNGRLADEFPAVRELAALAQFDLKPLTALLPIPEREQQNLNQLCRKAGRPPRWQFVHSSAAELVLHALCAGHGLDTPDAVAEWAGQRIVEYLGRVVESSASLASDTITIEPRALLRNRLTLLNREQESRLKLALLDDPAHAFLRLFAANGSVFELFKIVESASAALAEAMLTALEHNPDQVTHLIERTIQSQRSIGTLSLALRELRMDSERRALGERLERAIGGPAFLRLIAANGSVFELFSILKQTSAALAEAMLTALEHNPDQVTDLIERTIQRQRSIGTLDLTLRELRMDSERRALGERLERAIGGPAFLRLIAANGSVFELFSILKQTSAALAEAMLTALEHNPDQVTDLIERTIQSQRSIGTLSLALRELRMDPERRALGERLERAIGGPAFLRLIAANGSVSELFKIQEQASPALAEAMLTGLEHNPDQVTDLIERTIQRQRSIGTLDLTLRELRMDSERRALGERLERAIGGPAFLRLIAANGSVFELFSILKQTSAALAEAMLTALEHNPDQVTDLIERTIQSQRSIGTLSLALRELRMDPERRALGERLERIIGVQGFWSLIIGVGGAGPMLSLLGHMSPAFRKDFLSESSHLRSADWARVLERGDFFALVRLLNQGGALLTVPTTASELQTAVADTAAAITASSSWYARNGGRIRLEALPQTPHVAQLLEVLNRTLDAVTVDGLACASVQEGANALELLCRRRADARPLLAARLWRLVPPPPAWQLEPGKDSGVLRVLLRAMAYPEFDDGDARRVFDGCAAWLTPTRIAKLDAREVAGTLWALVALAAQRGWATHLCAAPAELPTTLRTALVADLSRRAGSASRDLNEVRGRFALAGLLSLAHAPLPQLAPPAGVAFVNAATTAWWLCANQSFVFAALVLRAVAQQWPLSPADQHLFRHHLEGAARQLLELDPAATWLLQDAQGTRSAPGMPQLPQSRPQR